MKNYRFILFIILGFLFTEEVKAQSTNCSTATSIDLSSGSACVNGTNVGALSDNTLYGACNTAPVDEVWYTYIANGSTNTFTITPGTMTDAEIIIYTGACPAAAGQLQVCHVVAGSTVLTENWGMTLGEQVWVGVASNQGTNGTFQLCINSNPPAPAAGNTCAQAIPLCNPTFSQPSMAVNSSGQLPTCFGSAPQQDIWFQFTITQAGNLAWTATPNNLTTEFDWCLWNIGAGCPGTVACCNYNYAGGSSDGFGMEAQTGTVACAYSNVSNNPQKEFCKPLAVTCGQTYAIQISNYVSDGTGFSFSFANSTCLINSTSSFTPTPSLICGTTLTAAIANGSTGDCAAVWNYGDGSATYTGTAPPNHTYNTPGTYEITETIGGACPSTASKPVQLLAPLAATATSTPVSCPGTCVGTASVSSVSGGDGIYTYSWNTGSTTNNISALCNGTYTVTVSNAKCGTSVTQTVTVVAPPALTLTPTSVNATCGNNNGSISLTATGGTSPYTYSKNEGAYSGTTNYTALGAGTYTMSVKDSKGCDTSIVVTITQSGTPTVTATSATVCPGGTATLTANGATAYAWSAGVTPTTGSIVTVSPGATTSYTVTGTDAGCTGTAVAIVTIGTGISVTVPSATICAGTSTTLTATGATNYTWTPATGLSATNGASVIANPVITTTYTINGATGACTGTGTTAVTVLANPTVTVTNSTICPGATATLTAAGATTYSWSTGATTTSITESPATTTSYTVTGTTATCTNSAVAIVTMAPSLSVTVNSPTICSGASATLTAIGGTTYSWSTGATTAIITESPVATTTYIVTGNTGGCTGTATSTVTIVANPTAAFNVAAVCQGTGSVFNNTSIADSACTWSFGGVGNPATAATICSPTFIYSAAGTFPVTLTVTAIGGCRATATGNAVVNTFPVLGFTANSPCDGLPVNFTNTTTNPTTISNWHWDFGDGDTSNVQSPVYTYTAPPGFIASNCYPVVLTATATTGCTGSFSTTVNIHNNPFAYFNAYEACYGTASEFIDSSFIQNPPCLNDQITSWQWSFGDGSPITTFNSATLPDTINYIYALCGTYNITLTVTTTNGCTNSNTLSGDNVFCLPFITAPPSFSICPGTAVTTAQTAFTTTCALPAVGPVESIIFVNNNPFFPNDYATSTHSGIPLADTVDFNNIPNYTAITPNLTCGLLIDTIYGVAITPISPANLGCIGNIQTFTISVYPTPTVTPTSNITVCAGATIPAINFIGCPTPETFNWTATPQVGGNIGLVSPGVGNISSFTGTNTSNAIAVTTVSVTPVANGCTGTTSGFNITVNPIPVMTAIGSTVCPGDIITPAITTNPANPAAGVTYAWTVTNNTNIGMPASGTGTPAIYTAPANTSLTNQIGVVTYTPTLGTCIGLSVTDTINIKPTPFMQHIPNQYWCPFNMTNAVTFGTLPPSANSTFSWNYNAGGIPTAGTTNVFPSLGPTSNGGLTTLSTLINVTPTLNGCTGPDSTFTLFVYPQPQPNFSFNTVCLNSATSFTNTSMPNSGANAVTGWDWNFGAGQIGAGQNPSNIFPTAGTQTVTLIVTTSPNPPLTNGALGCADTITKNPVVDPNPVANFYGDSVGCTPFSTLLIDNSTPVGSIATWAWNFGNGNTSNSQFPNAQNYINANPIQPANYTVSLTVATAAGCSNTKKVKNYIQVNPSPVAGFSWGPTSASIDNPTINFANQSQGASEYTVTTPPIYGPNGVEYYLGDIYAPNDSVNNVYTNGNFSYSYVNNGNQLQTDDTAYYTVKQWVINRYGCTDSISHVVDIQPVFTFYIPNSFTPNGDGKNEGFKGIGLGINNNTYNMWVFDRWGLMIYYATDINKAWDGHKLGNEGQPVLQEDVYVWKVQFNDFTGLEHQYHGTVTLIK